jgi:hypothetical protein
VTSLLLDQSPVALLLLVHFPHSRSRRGYQGWVTNEGCSSALRALRRKHCGQIRACRRQPAATAFGGSIVSDATATQAPVESKTKASAARGSLYIFYSTHNMLPLPSPSPSAPQQATATARDGRAGAGAVAAPRLHHRRLRGKPAPLDPLAARRRRRPRSTRAPESPRATSCRRGSTLPPRFVCQKVNRMNANSPESTWFLGANPDWSGI